MKVKAIDSKVWSQGRVLDLPQDYAESLISQGVVEEIKEKTNVIKGNKSKNISNNTSGNEGISSSEE